MVLPDNSDIDADGDGLCDYGVDVVTDATLDDSNTSISFDTNCDSVCDTGTVGGDAQTPTNISDDTDCDGVENSSDLFPNDATESGDTDADGIETTQIWMQMVTDYVTMVQMS